MNIENLKQARKQAHNNFMKLCFEEANNIMSQSLAENEYTEDQAQAFRHGYWMAKWTALGDFGIDFGFHRTGETDYVASLPKIPRSVID